MDLSRYDTKRSVFLDTSTPFTFWERVKVGLLLFTVPPRLLVALVVLLLFALVSYVSTFGWPEGEPLKGWRKSLMHLSCLFSRSCVYLMGFRMEIKGWENYHRALKEGVQIAVFNHVSYVDAFALVGLMGCSGLSKESNKNLPILGTCVKGLQNIYLPDSRQVIRGKNGQKTATKRADSVSEQITQRAQDRRYPMLALAPEGTCGNGYSLIKFRTGAFVCGAPVLPVLLKYDTSVINPAWTIVNEPIHFLRVLCNLRNKVTVTFLEPYVPSAAEKADASFYAENVRILMGKALGVPLVEESYNHFYGLNKLGVKVLWDGQTIEAPPGVIDDDGYIDLTPILEDKKTT